MSPYIAHAFINTHAYIKKTHFHFLYLVPCRLKLLYFREDINIAMHWTFSSTFSVKSFSSPTVTPPNIGVYMGKKHL